MIVLVIDVQNGITDNRLYNFNNFISNVKKIITTARNNNFEVIYVQHDDGAGSGFSVGDEEFDIYPDIYPHQNEKRFIKTTNSAFCNQEFKDYVHNLHEDTLVIVGLQTNFCIDATIKSAYDLGYQVIVPKNANSTFDNAYMDKETTYQYYNEFIWPDRFAKCMSVEETLQLMNKKK